MLCLRGLILFLPFSFTLLNSWGLYSLGLTPEVVCSSDNSCRDIRFFVFFSRAAFSVIVWVGVFVLSRVIRGRLAEAWCASDCGVATRRA
ncbi:hypothetical protein EDB85DRAFT_2038752 [Lactarius pseudohatsudake]|nr:hypothetical protein EDB85DRAFT_2038752 [Lactarius pseudohatsudake]